MRSMFLKTFILFVFLGCIQTQSFAQQNAEFDNQLGISIPLIWSRSNATFFSLGSPKYPSATDMNYGIDVNYSKVIYHGLFGIIGLGYFNHSFSIKRPFHYVTPDNTKPLVSTKYYEYQSIYWSAGLGYKNNLTKYLAAKGIISYNNFSSYRQRYAQEYYPGVNEVYNKNLPLGYMITLDVGIDQRITNRISIGTSVVVPLQTHWNDDKMFVNNFYSPHEQQIAKNQFSIGASFSCNYHF